MKLSRPVLAALLFVGTVVGFARMKPKKSEMLYVRSRRGGYNSIGQQLARAGCSVDNHDPKIPVSHFPYRPTMSIPDEFDEKVILTGVREPYDLLRSQYRNSNVHARNTSFATWYLAHEGVPSDAANYCNAIGFVRSERVIHDPTAAMLGFSDMEASSITKQVLMSSIFNFIFVLERLEESYDMFAATFQSTRAVVNKNNQGGHASKLTDNDTMTTRAMDRFVVNNPRDLRIYALANEILDDMIVNVSEGKQTYSQEYITQVREDRIASFAAEPEAHKSEKAMEVEKEKFNSLDEAIASTRVGRPSHTKPSRRPMALPDLAAIAAKASGIERDATAAIEGNGHGEL